MKPLLLTLIFSLLPFAFLASAAERPNFICILVDDLGYADVSFQDVVAEDVETPNIDRLAKTGVVFTEAYASSPICSTSRLAFLTGRYQTRWGGYWYGQGGLPNDEQTIAELLRDQGYKTMKVGKTHLNHGEKPFPLDHGFDEYLGFEHHSWDFYLLSEKDKEAYEARKAGSTEAPQFFWMGPLTRNREKVSYENSNTTDIFADESVAFIERNAGNPFYLQLEFNAVHTLLTVVPDEYAEKYDIPKYPFNRDATAESWDYPYWDPQKEEYKEWYSDVAHLVKVDPYGRKKYLVHLEMLDKAIGRITKALEATNQLENTFIVFSSDNGGSHQSYANNGPLHVYKYCIADGGIKVPMFVTWPNGIEGDKRIEALVTHRDVFATIADITDTQPKKELDAKSLLPLIEGKVDHLHDELFWDTGKNSWAYRDGDWKLALFPEKEYTWYEIGEDGLVKPELNTTWLKEEMALFNLKEDEGETTNLADEHPEKVEAMLARYQEWRATQSDPVRGKKK
ncbi:MAG: sulfatase-like hydrolase/transferase [Verrucomicrobiota bacterium]